MTRKEELLKIVDNDIRLTELVENIISTEERLAELRKLPFIRVHPKQPDKQKATDAARQFTQLSGAYNSMIRTLASISGKDDLDNEESPLRKWVANRGNI